MFLSAELALAPKGNPAYPAVVKRQIVEQARGVFVKMNFLCEAKKDACDNLAIDFQTLNDSMTRSQNQAP